MGDAAGTEVLDAQGFHQLAPLHHPDRRAEMGDHGEVVADEDVGEPARGLKIGEQVEDLGLDRDVERAGGLVEQQRLRARRSAHGRSPRAGAGRRKAGADSGSGDRAAGRPLSSARGMRVSISPIPWTISGSASWRSIVWRGCSEP